MNFLLDRVTVLYGNDKGQNVNQVEEQFEKLDQGTMDALDQMISIVLNDANARLTITGSASPNPSDNNNTMPLSNETNAEIAANRTRAGLEFIRKYARERFCQEINLNQIIVNSQVPTDDGINSNNDADRNVSFSISSQGSFTPAPAAR